MNAYITYKYPDLMHYGIERRSGRFPWGSGKRPFQSLEGDQKDNRRDRRVKELLEKKEEVLKTGTASQVAKYRGMLSNDELRKVSERLRLESQIAKMAGEEELITSGFKKIDSIMKDVEEINKWGKVGVDTYNSLVSIYNMTEEGSKNPMKKIS